MYLHTPTSTQKSPFGLQLHDNCEVKLKIILLVVYTEFQILSYSDIDFFSVDYIFLKLSSGLVSNPLFVLVIKLSVQR